MKLYVTNHRGKTLINMKQLIPIFFIMNSLACDEVYESSQYRPQVIELYTSEGCSSCPPADKWLNSLSKDSRLWRDIFPLKFHVDYWDYIGWKDTLASPAHTERQRKYAKAWKSRNIYTPGFALNGKEWRSYFSRTVPKETKNDAPKLKVKKDKNKYIVDYKKKPEEALKLSMALLGSGIKHRIRRGENAGKYLEHNFVVLKYKSQRMNGNQLEIKVPKFKKKGAESFHVVFWLEKENSKEIIQAAGGCAML